MKQHRLHHEALIYGSDEELLTMAVPFLRDGAAAGEPALLAVPEPLQRLVLAELDAPVGVTVLGCDHYQGPLSALQATSELSARLVGDGARRIRILGAIPPGPSPEWVRYEAAVNHVLAEMPIWGICLYDARSTSDEVLMDVERTHPHLSPRRDGIARRRPYENPATLVNESNRAEAEQLATSSPGVELIDPSATRARRALTTLAYDTALENQDIDTLCLCVAAALANARQHGRRPVRMRAWAAPECLEVTVRDAGRGPVDPFVGLTAPCGGEPAVGPDTMHLIHQAVSSVALHTDDDGFTIRLTQRATV